MASIRKLPSGKYQGQFRPVAGGKQITRTSSRRATVQLWLDEQIAGQVTGTFTHPKDGKTTFASFYETWSQRQVWETGTRRAVDLAVLSAPFRDVALARITRAHVEEWVKAMQVQDRGADELGTIRRGLAPQTIKTRIRNARTVFRAAIADRKITSDPTAGVRLPATRRTEAAMAIPTPEDVRAILERSSDQYRGLFAVCAFAGLRLGEASALKVGDVDFLKRTISVRRQAQRGRGETEIRLPKYGSERVVAAADGLLRLLAAQVTLMGLEGDREAWLFARERGGPAAPSTVNSAWLAARRGGFTMHDLRHFYASGLIAAGCDVSTVQHALGHSSPSVTLNTYTHLWPKSDDRTRAAAQGLVDEVFRAADEFLTNDGRASQ